jgi:hypothetical protein
MTNLKAAVLTNLSKLNTLSIKQSVDVDQVSYFNKNNFYKQEPKKTVDDLEREVHVYDGPRGKGYEVRYTKQVGEDTYLKVDHTGPEKHRSFDWQKLSPPEEI